MRRDIRSCDFKPPYIRDDEYEDLQPEVRQWDPPLALLAGADGLVAYRAILDKLGRTPIQVRIFALKLARARAQML